MKKSLLATVAAVALLAGPAMAQRQDAPAGKTEAPARAPSSMQNAPAEKVAPATPSARDTAPSTTGQAAPGQTTPGQATPGGKPGGAEMKGGSDTRSGSDTRTQNRNGAESKPGTDAAQGKSDGKAAANAPLTTEQKTKIRTSVLTSSAPRVTNVNFSVRVGTVVPKSVRIVAVPAPLIEIYPAYRGKLYFVYNDQIVIVDPDTMEIITVILV